MFEAHNAIGYSMRVVRVTYEYRGDTCDNALSFVLKVVSKNIGLIADLQDADLVCTWYTASESWKPWTTVDYRSLYVRVYRGVPIHLIPDHTLALRA